MADSLTVVLTGATHGRRMTSLGPKPLWPVTERDNVFDCQLRTLNRLGTERPLVVGGYQPDRLAAAVGYAASVVVNREWSRYGCGCSAQVGLYHARPGRVLLAHGDVVYNHFSVPPSGSWLVTTETPSPGCGEVGITAGGGWAVNLEYGLKTRWAQAVVLDKAERDILADLPLRYETLHESLNRVIDRGGRFGLHESSGLKMIDVDKVNDLAAARRMWTQK